MWKLDSFMNPASDIPYLAFEGDRCIASGELRNDALAAKETLNRRKDTTVLVFDSSSRPIDIDFPGSVADVFEGVPGPDTSDAPDAVAAPAGRRGPARQQGQGPDQAGARSGLSFHRGDGGEQTALRGSGARAVRGRRRAVSGLDGVVARRRGRLRPPERRGGVRTTGRAREHCRLIARM